MMTGGLIHTGIQVGAGLLALAGGGRGGTLPPCSVPAPPRVAVTVTEGEIRYDYKRSSAELDVIGEREKRGGSRDSMTGGLRVDAPEIEMRVQWGYSQDILDGRPLRVCLWYDSVEVAVRMNPVIYIARENRDAACFDAIMAHERRHVAVDRQVAQGFAERLRAELERMVAAAGPVGPLAPERRDAAGQELQKRVTAIVERHKRALETEGEVRQKLVDTPEEYARISAICNEARRR